MSNDKEKLERVYQDSGNQGNNETDSSRRERDNCSESDDNDGRPSSRPSRRGRS